MYIELSAIALYLNRTRSLFSCTRNAIRQQSVNYTLDFIRSVGTTPPNEGGGGGGGGKHIPPITFDASDAFISSKFVKSLISIFTAPSI